MVQLNLLNRGPPTIRRFFALPDADLSLDPSFLSPSQASELLLELQHGVDWRQDTVEMFGRRHLVPRLHQWFADDGQAYSWSGVRMHPQPWRRSLRSLRDRIHQGTGIRFNTALANLYRDGNDTVALHSDDEPELGERPTIASLSLGAVRDFVLRHRIHTDLREVIQLPHGSLLLMRGDTQRCWKHGVPRRSKIRTPRLNLTFRIVAPPNGDTRPETP